MSTLYLDRQSNNWKIKTTSVEGKDTRVKLRKATQAEQQTWASGNRDYPPDLATRVKNQSSDFRCEKKKSLDPQSLLGFLEWYQADHASRSRPNSVMNLALILDSFRQYIRQNLGKTNIADTTEDMMIGYFNWRRNQINPKRKVKVKDTTAVKELEILSGVWSVAENKGLINRHPLRSLLKRLRKAYPRPEKIKYLDPKERLDFLKKLEEAVIQGKIPRVYSDVAIVLISTGLRVQACIDLEYSWICPNWDVDVPPKNDKAKTGYLASVADLGRHVLIRRRAESTGIGQVFPEVVNQHMVYYYLSKLGVHPHKLRHTFAVTLVKREVPILVISEMLGHHCLKTTQIYAKVLDDARHKAIAKLDITSL